MKSDLWMKRHARRELDFYDDDPEAVEAVRYLGTNAIPTLLRLIRTHDSTREQNRQAHIAFSTLLVV